MKKYFFSIIILIAAATVCAQSVAILIGKVTDQSGTPLSNVVVRVCNQGLSTLTDNAGYYQFFIPTTGTVNPVRRPVNASGFAVTKTKLSLTLAKRQAVTAALYDLQGRQVVAIVKNELEEGAHDIALPFEAMKNRIVILRVSAGPSVHCVRFVNGNPDAGAFAPLPAEGSRGLARDLADPVVDTLAASRYGYSAVHILLTSYSGNLPIVLKPAATFFLAPDTGVSKCHDESFFPPGGGTPQMIRVCASIAISRTYADSTCMRMLRLAESLPPDTAELFKVMPDQEKQAIPPSEKNGVWWCLTINMRIPYAITDKAVKYYADSTLDWFARGGGPLQMTYNADVKYYDTYDTYAQVYVAHLSLAFQGGIGFSKQRIVVFDKNGKLLNILGDGVPQVTIYD
jgi:hypothetical protein